MNEYRLISPKSKLALKQKVLCIIQSHSSPHHAVCFSHLGSGGSYSPEKRLHTFQNIQLRRAANAPWFVRNEVLHKDLNVPPLLDFIKKQSENFFDRLLQISNESIREIPAYDNSIPSSSKRPRAVLNHSYQDFPALKRMRMS
ncbi:RNA-directed DNA polymerase from mobile element jockey [Trichonephila clavipes]|nr:RNA-directed DNA polymerase from mobile element jockey [Trichonephila clavipes]